MTWTVHEDHEPAAVHAARKLCGLFDEAAHNLDEMGEAFCCVTLGNWRRAIPALYWADLIPAERRKVVLDLYVAGDAWLEESAAELPVDSGVQKELFA